MRFLRLVLGIICGIAATGPMSVVMVLLHRRLPDRQRYPLPPREIMAQTVDQIMPSHGIRTADRSALTWLAHFGYGGAAGAIYAAAQPKLPGGVAAKGPLFGSIVWIVSYLGLLPGLRILSPATEHPWRRNALMIVAHFIWGWFLAAMYQVLLSDRQREDTAFDISARSSRDRIRASRRS